MKNTKLQNLGIAVASVLVCFALGAGAARAGDDRHDDNDKDGKFLLISFEENVMFNNNTGTGTLDGKATLAGALNDRGVRHEDFHVTSVSSDGSRVGIAGTSVIHGSKGDVFTQFSGTIVFSADPAISYVEGVESITGGTLIYKDARGKGTFEATQDFIATPYQVAGVFELQLKSQK
jgi:hypothetical protein